MHNVSFIIDLEWFVVLFAQSIPRFDVRLMVTGPKPKFRGHIFVNLYFVSEKMDGILSAGRHDADQLNGKDHGHDPITLHKCPTVIQPSKKP